MKKIFSLVLATLLAICLFAQNPSTPASKPGKEKPTPEQVQKMKTGHLIAELGLDNATAVKFEALYTEYKAALKAAKAAHPVIKPQKDAEGNLVRLTDEEVEQNILNRFAQARAMVDVREAYYKKFRTILTPQQIEKVYADERHDAEMYRHEHARRQGAPRP